MNWLEIITIEEIETGAFPLQEVLKDSLFYPSSGFDGGVVKDCNTAGIGSNIVSFIYCDYAIGYDAFIANQNNFLGYHPIASRNIQPKGLIPNGWNPKLPPQFDLDDYSRYRSSWNPFVTWTVYELDENRTLEHGRKRFSLLYIGGEGVATYQAIYWSNKTKPKALAIIRPGTGFGLNWTDFRDKNGPLAWVVKNKKIGMPELIYTDDKDFDWDHYTQLRVIENYDENATVRVFKLKNNDKPKHPFAPDPSKKVSPKGFKFFG